MPDTYQNYSQNGPKKCQNGPEKAKMHKSFWIYCWQFLFQYRYLIEFASLWKKQFVLVEEKEAKQKICNHELSNSQCSLLSYQQSIWKVIALYLSDLSKKWSSYKLNLHSKTILKVRSMFWKRLGSFIKTWAVILEVHQIFLWKINGSTELPYTNIPYACFVGASIKYIGHIIPYACFVGA